MEPFGLDFFASQLVSDVSMSLLCLATHDTDLYSLAVKVLSATQCVVASPSVGVSHVRWSHEVIS